MAPGSFLAVVGLGGLALLPSLLADDGQAPVDASLQELEPPGPPLAFEWVEIARVHLAAQSTDLPAAVRARMAELSCWYLDDVGGDLTLLRGGTDPAQVMNLPRPGRPSLQLWFRGVPVPGGWNPVIAIFAYDPETDATTPEPYLYDAHFVGQLEHGMLPRLVDLDLDGRHELALRRHEHNGTMVDADHVDFLRVGPGLAIERVYSYQERIVDIRTPGEEGVIRRQLHRARPGAADLLLASWTEAPALDARRAELPPVAVRYDPAARSWTQAAGDPY